jgi:hypothetical protein
LHKHHEREFAAFLKVQQQWQHITDVELSITLMSGHMMGVKTLLLCPHLALGRQRPCVSFIHGSKPVPAAMHRHAPAAAAPAPAAAAGWLAAAAATSTAAAAVSRADADWL